MLKEIGVSPHFIAKDRRVLIGGIERRGWQRLSQILENQSKAAKFLGSNPPSWLWYAFAGSLTLSAVALRWWLEIFGDGVVPVPLFFPVILVCTLVGGIGPGLFVLIIAMVAVKVPWSARDAADG
ncbi:MAG: hypothetical protein U1D06_13745 [Paracoccaceae bacterium]|nr:hypothetical protein [Paracoccaceae bacterium]